VKVKTTGTAYKLTTTALSAALIAALVAAGWLIYSRLPPTPTVTAGDARSETVLQVVLRTNDLRSAAFDISVDLYPIDLVAARHEYFTERRAGKRFDDFLNERMQGRQPVNARLDKQGQGFVGVPAGNWWLHAVLAGEEELEWRLPITVTGRKQVVELSSQNVYMRTRSF
jgi:hypothetical protein